MTTHSQTKARERVAIRVTQADIDAGVPHDCACCPVARAVERKFAARIALVNDDGGAEVLDGWPLKVRKFDFSETVSRRIEHFDETGEMKPFTFVLKERKDDHA